MSRGARALFPILAAAALFATVRLALAALGGAWDFETYYFAGVAWRAGMNPYSLADLTKLAHRTVTLPFLYPPVTLAVFVPWTLLPKGVAFAAWLGLQCALIVWLLTLWRRHILPGFPVVCLIALSLIGFDRSLGWALRTGNIAILETALLWFGLAQLVHGRDALAAAAIALASLFKLTPIALLGLVALVPRRERVPVRFIAIGALAVVLAIVLPPSLASAWRGGLLHAPPDAHVGIASSPTALGLADAVATAADLSPHWIPRLAVTVYLAVSVLILAASIMPLRRARRSGSRLELALLGVTVWLLLAPRLMIYSFAMGIPAVIHALRTRMPRHPEALGILVLPSAVGFVAPAAVGVLAYVTLLATWALLIRPATPPPHEDAGPSSPAPAPR